jgi:glycosyltransferase involved in cell wall biosynthesis
MRPYLQLDPSDMTSSPNDIWRSILKDDPRLAVRPSFRFDPIFYAASYPDVSGSPEELVKHFRNFGRSEHRFPNRFRQFRTVHHDIARRVRLLIVDPRIRDIAREKPALAAELAFELIRFGYDSTISNFSASHYLASNPDVAEAGVDPLEHYLTFGIRERRPSLAKVRKSQFRGSRPYDANLPTCLIALHELSNTGAPRVGLDLATEARGSHNVVVAALRPGPLLQAARESACEVLVTANPFADLNYFRGAVFDHIDMAVCNSVEAFPFVRTLVARGVPFASYIHEYAWYTFPSFKSIHTLLFSDLLVFSSEHVRESWAPLLEDAEFDLARDLMVLPQRNIKIDTLSRAEIVTARKRLSSLVGVDCSDKRIICGAGHSQWRKGTDIFAMAAQIARQRDPDTLFVWVGDGLNPEDVVFGAWMTHHLREVGAGEVDSNLFMLPAGDHYQDVLKAADAMLLSSRLDPLPNVVFDALAAGCRIVLFEGSSGFADPAYTAYDYIKSVEYGNPEAAVDELLSIPRKAPARFGAERRHERWGARLFDPIRANLTMRLRDRRHYVIGPTPLDVPVLYSARDEDRPLRTREREKLFTTGRRYLWRDPDDAKASLRESRNWVHRRCSVVDYREIEPGSDLPPFSLHMHAYYVDGLRAELSAHRAFRFADELVVTTDSEKKARAIHAAVASLSMTVKVLVVPNRGRDIVPFLDLLRGLEADDPSRIWGHIHRKKSLSTRASGDVWRTFMTTILLGGPDSVSNSIVSAADPKVGLVAPFDPFFGQWNGSRALLTSVRSHFPGPLPKNPLVYPMGNMFWVRAAVVNEMNLLFRSDHPWPNEPIPNDGTDLHLVERLWPVVAAKRGLRSVFVSKPDQRRSD